MPLVLLFTLVPILLLVLLCATVLMISAVGSGASPGAPGAVNHSGQDSAGISPTVAPTESVPLEAEGLVCVSLPGVAYPKTPALDRRVARRLFDVTKTAHERGIGPWRYNYGFRTSCEQARIRPVGTSQKAPVGASGHERGAAVDVQQLFARNDVWAVINLFREHGWSWKPTDKPHFEVKPWVVGEPDRFAWVRRQQKAFQEGRLAGACRGGPCGGL